MSFVKFKKDYGFVKRGSSDRQEKDCDILIRMYENNNYFLENQLIDPDNIDLPLRKNYILYDLNWEEILETPDLNLIKEYLDK